MGLFDSTKQQSGNHVESCSFAKLPQNVQELQILPEAVMDSPFKTAALTVAALCRYEENVEECIAMLDYLKGPESVSVFEKQFMKERLAGKGYKPFSFFKGATPENGYQPMRPYTIAISASPYSYPEENWATLYVTSTGADSPRGIKLRKKPSTGQWFLNEIQCLSDIRIPTKDDPWV